MKQLWTLTSNGIGLIVVALGVILADNRGSTDMTGGTGGQAQQRMIAAIVDHPQGPHFLKATGPADVVKKWSASIHTFMDSAKAN